MYHELEEISLFETLKASDLEEIAKYVIVKSYKRNECILLEGKMNRQFCIIKKGKIKISCSDRNGKEVIFALLGEGDFFGEMSIIDKDHCSATVTCMQACKIYCMKDIYFKRLLTKVPGLAYHLLNHMSRRLRCSNRCIENLNCRNSLHRVGSVLLDLAEYSGYRYKKSVIIKKIPFQHDIAAIAGISRETVSRSFSQLEEGNYIKKSGRHLVITDYPRFYNIFSS